MTAPVSDRPAQTFHEFGNLPAEEEDLLPTTSFRLCHR
jgi:hypothetical protein